MRNVATAINNKEGESRVSGAKLLGSIRGEVCPNSAFRHHDPALCITVLTQHDAKAVPNNRAVIIAPVDI